MDRKRVKLLDTVLVSAGVAALALLFLAATKPGRPVLTVWSCGSNYESISDFSRHFEQEYDCHVRYTAAPVQYLLELAMSVETPPDVMVGRGGPGWEALRQEGKLAKGPVFFALDPYVIITPPDNPANIQSIEDLGREGVRVAASPWAMRPRGKCPAHLMFCVSDKFFPGLVERWENNITVPMKCGRNLAEPVVAGKADAAIVPHCMTNWRGVSGNVHVVPIKPEHLLSLKQCRATIPQCCGMLIGAQSPELAERFLQEATDGIGPKVFSRHGYLPINSPEGHALTPLIQVFKPKDAAGWQAHLAKGLYADGAYLAALRRCAQVISLFGPNHYQARSRFLAGQCLKTLGKPEAARLQWERLIDEFPRPGRLEWESKVLHVGKPVPGIEKLPEEHWVDKAREALSSLEPGPHVLSRRRGSQLDPDPDPWLEAFPIEHVPVKESDPAKNGTRNLEIGKDLLEAGHYVGAARDLLKVLSLNYPSRHMPEAHFWLGVVSHLRGLPEQAASHWQALSAGDAGGEWAKQARKALQLASASPAPQLVTASTSVAMPEWTPAYDTHAQRGMTYGMMLWEHELPLYCFKEMVKIIHGVYGKPGPLAAQARYRAGVCCLALGRPEAAHSQWTLCELCWPNTPWAKKAGQAKKKLLVDQRRDLPYLQKYRNPEAVTELKKPPKGEWVKRFRCAEEFFNAEIFQDDQCLLEYWKAMTVTDPSQEKNVKIRPKAELKCGIVLRKMGREKAARRHFERVLELYPESPAAEKARAALKKGGD